MDRLIILIDLPGSFDLYLLFMKWIVYFVCWELPDEFVHDPGLEHLLGDELPQGHGVQVQHLLPAPGLQALDELSSAPGAGSSDHYEPVAGHSS